MKADKKKAARLLKTARGQMDGLLRMVEEDRYCIDISNQLLATIAILNRVNRDVLEAHMQSCVVEAIREGQEKEKITEIMDIVEKLTR